MHTLLEAALTARERAYAPYSDFKVGAAVRDENGRLFTGCNVESASYGLSICAERVAVIKAIYDAESKLIKIDEARGRLISVDRALSMINEAMQSAILVLRRLPEMGRTPEERARLEAFMNGVLAEIKAGAAAGLKYADRSLVLRNVLSGNGLGCKRAESHDKSHNT